MDRGVPTEAVLAEMRNSDPAVQYIVGTPKGRYLLRTNLTDNDPALLWQYYIQLVAVEEAFKNLKDDLAIRPIFHKDEKRIEAHIFIAFLATACTSSWRAASTPWRPA